MRVLFITTTFPKPAEADLFPWALDRARNLQGAGASVRTCVLLGGFGRRIDWAEAVSTRPPKLAERLIGMEVDYVPWPLLSRQRLTRPIFHRQPSLLLWPAWRSLRGRLHQICDRFQPDLLLANVPLVGGYVAWKLGKERKLPFVLQQEDLMFLTWAREQAAVAALARRVYEDAARVLPVASIFVEEILQIAPAARVEPVNDGIAALDRSALPSRPADGQTILFSASDFTPRKEQPALVRAFAEATRTLDSARSSLVQLRLAGEGPDLAECRRIAAAATIADRVEFLGRIPRAQVLREVSRSDAVILPSYREPLATVLIEAMAAGKPIVCASDGGIGQAITDGVEGWVIPPRDTAALTKALVEVLSAPDRLATMGTAALAKFQTQFRGDRAGQNLYRVLSTVLQSEEP